jgi:hypothetical protein
MMADPNTHPKAATNPMMVDGSMPICDGQWSMVNGERVHQPLTIFIDHRFLPPGALG